MGRSVFEPVAKAVRLDRALAVKAVRRAGTVKPLQTPLADARLGPVRKSAFGVEHSIAKGVPTPARLRVVGPKPGQPVTPAQGAVPKPPLTQRLNNAVTATGGSPT